MWYSWWRAKGPKQMPTLLCAAARESVWEAEMHRLGRRPTQKNTSSRNTLFVYSANGGTKSATQLPAKRQQIQPKSKPPARSLLCCCSSHCQYSCGACKVCHGIQCSLRGMICKGVRVRMVVCLSIYKSCLLSVCHVLHEQS